MSDEGESALPSFADGGVGVDEATRAREQELRRALEETAYCAKALRFRVVPVARALMEAGLGPGVVEMAGEIAEVVERLCWKIETKVRKAAA